jgi:hypothetical protein
MATARLPGIYFETVPALPPALLPRMDVAAFAGFLPSGPIGMPFMVEDPHRFQDIFGTDLALAWDRERNQMRLAQTPPAVRTFFRNGGQRCWVLRLANGAMSDAWTIPGLLQVGAEGCFHAGWVQARSEGSWSDELTVNATLLESPLPPQASGWPGNGPRPQPPVGLDPGDVAQLFFPDSGALAYFDFSSSQRRTRAWFWFQPAALTAPGSPPLGQPENVFFLGAGTDTPVAFTSFAMQSGELVLGLSRDLALKVPPGSWLRMQFGSQTLLVQVEAMEAGLSTSGSPPADEMATLTSTLAWWVSDPAEAWAANRGQSLQTSIVTFELWAWPQGAPAQQIAGLGFSQENPQYWGLLPTDAVLYAPVTRPAPLPYAALAAEIDNPRFPLAGPTTAGLGLPLGMTALVEDNFTQGATLPGATALDRDGLASFDPSLFIDPHLVDSTSTTLLQDAFYWQNQAQNGGPLSGVHALLGTDEISMIAVPDAIHSGWQPAPTQTPTLAPPDSVQVSTPDESGNYTVSWTAVTSAAGYTVAGYTLDESSDPLFQTAVTSRDAGVTLSMALSSNTQCPLVLYYRVSAYGSAGNGPWSKTAHVELGTGDFVPSGAPPLDAPQLDRIEERNRIVLEWTPAPGPVDSYTLQTAGDPLFESGYALYQGKETTFQYWTTPGPPSYFRVNAQRSGQSSPWSNTVTTTQEPVSPWEVVPFLPSSPPSEPFTPPSKLFAVHKTLLVMAAARGDLVAIMSLPYSFRKSEAVAYEAALAIAATADSLRTPSYGALYHPWVVTPDNTNPPPQSLRTLVPDGAVCGVIASTTLASGAWIAPANVAVSNAVALAPALESDAAVAFAAAQINLIAQQPEGFMITSQDTLMPDGDPLQPLNVRRLLILLRRLALREGVRYVFQNISPSLQRSVTRQFQQWMQLLLARGAFAGPSAQDSYQVIADATVNTPDSMDQGRFIVELKVAPSVPMSFLTVKLVQSGGQLALVEG